MKRVKITLFLVTVLLGATLWLWLMQPRNLAFNGMVFTTDTAISTEAHFIRHKSITDLSEVFGLGPGLLPYFPSDYVWGIPSYLDAHEEMQ